MKVFLAGTSDKNFITNINDCKYILESFYYFQKWQIPLIKTSDMFLLDSGAFTFMNAKKNSNFDELKSMTLNTFLSLMLIVLLDMTK